MQINLVITSGSNGEWKGPKVKSYGENSMFPTGDMKVSNIFDSIASYRSPIVSLLFSNTSISSV